MPEKPSNRLRFVAISSLLVGMFLASAFFSGILMIESRQEAMEGKERVRKGGTRLTSASTATTASSVASAMEEFQLEEDIIRQEEEQQQQQQVQVTEPAQQPPPHRPINYMHTPDTFVETMQACEADRHCKLFFHHAYKTGGTTIELNLYRFWNQSRIGYSCCDNKRWHVFQRYQEEMCEAKYTAHQVNSTVLFKMVDECVNKHPVRKGRSQKPRAVILSSFREPIQLTISWVSTHK